MSKNKGGKNIKKVAGTETKKPVSEYQNDKKTVSKTEVTTAKKK